MDSGAHEAGVTQARKPPQAARSAGPGPALALSAFFLNTS